MAGVDAEWADERVAEDAEGAPLPSQQVPFGQSTLDDDDDDDDDDADVVVRAAPDTRAPPTVDKISADTDVESLVGSIRNRHCSLQRSASDVVGSPRSSVVLQANPPASPAEAAAAAAAPARPAQDPSTVEFRRQWQACQKHMFIFSDASRPIYTRFGDETDFLDFFGMMGLLVELTGKTMASTERVEQAGVNSKARSPRDQGAEKKPASDAISPSHQLRYFKAGGRTYVVVRHGRILFLAASKTGESVASLAAQLNFLNAMLLSILTSGMYAIYEKRANYDLRGLLGDSANLMIKGGIRLMNNNPAFGLSSVPVLRIRRGVRDNIARALKTRLSDCGADSATTPFAFLLYHLPEDKAPYGGVGGSNNVLMIAYCSEERQNIHPKDFCILANFVQSSLPTASKYQEMWAPCCLPEYSKDGYLYLYMTFISPTVSLVVSSSTTESFPVFQSVRDALAQDFCLTPRERIVSGIPPAEPATGPLAEVAAARFYGVSTIDVSEKGSPEDVLHFIYKDCDLGQHTMSRFGPPFVARKVQKELLRQYLTAKEGAQTCAGAKRTVIFASEEYIVLARIGKSYELYVTYKPLTSKPQISMWATSLKKWVRAQGECLFAPPR